MPLWTDQKLRVATIGCGRMGAQTSPNMRSFAPSHLRILSHLEAVRSLGMASALAASDISVEALAQAKEKFELDFVTTDYHDLIDKFRPDILTVATRTPEKASIIAAAAQGRVRALHIEKPLCNSAAELLEIERLANEHGLLITSGCLRRYLSPFQGAERLFERHGLGQIGHVNIGMGKASLMWTQFHAIDLVLHYAGGRKLGWVQGNLGPLAWTNGNTVVQNDPLLISATLAFEGDFSGTIGQTAGNTTTLSSALGQLEIFADGRAIFLAKRMDPEDPYLSKEPIKLDSGELSGTQAPLWLLAKALGGDKRSVDLVAAASADFLTAQSVALALIESHRQNGRRVEMSNFASQLTILGMTDGRYA
jgi:scyllo-inositol 2-dehydrogenase (NAD+)